MKKIHIALVGGQPIPVYLGIMHQECDEILLVHSSTSLKEAQTIEKQCGKQCTLIKCSPNDINEIQTVADSLYDKFENCDVVLNITSGTKTWTIFFYQRFLKHPHAKFIYIDQLNNLFDLTHKEQHTLSIDVFDRFKLYGNPLKKYTPLDFFTEKDFSAIKDIERVRRSNVIAFTELTNKEQECYDINNGQIVSDNGSTMSWNWPEGRVQFDIVGYRGHYCNPVYIELDHPQEVVLHTAWFELKTALELRKNKGIKNIFVGCEFLTKDENAKNEVDIIADFGTRLLFVECKTMVKDITAIDKFRSAMRNFSGTSSIGIFVTNDKVKPKSIREKLFLAAIEKCKDNDILTFNFDNWNGRDNSALNCIINNHLSNINKR